MAESLEGYILRIKGNLDNRLELDCLRCPVTTLAAATGRQAAFPLLGIWPTRVSAVACLTAGFWPTALAPVPRGRAAAPIRSPSGRWSCSGPPSYVRRSIR